MVTSPPAKRGFVEVARSRIVEGRTLGPNGHLPITFAMVTRLTAAAPRGTARWVVPPGFRLRLQELRGIVRFADATAETITTGGTYTAAQATALFTFGGLKGRIAAKAANCRVSLQRSDTGIALLQGDAMPLSDLRGRPRFFDTPAPINERTSINLVAALQDTGAAGADATEYGLLVTGTLVSIR